MAIAVASALIGAGGAIDESAAKKKKPKNPLAGNWVGSTASTITYSGAPAPLSYRITRNGTVVDFTTTVTLDRTPSGGNCPNPIQSTVAMPPAKMNKPSETYPKGKRFTFDGTNISPPARLYANGKVGIGSKQAPGMKSDFQGYRKMEGAITLGGQGTIEVSPGVICRTGAVYWSATRTGGK